MLAAKMTIGLQGNNEPKTAHQPDPVAT